MADELPSSDISAPLQHLLSAWRTHAPPDGLPGRRDLGPEKLVSILDRVFLIDVIDGGVRFRYRLIGSRVAEWSGGDATGRYLDDPSCGPNRFEFEALVRLVVERRGPVWTLGRKAIFGGSAHLFDRVMLPLAADGDSIDMVIGVADARPTKG